MQLPLLAYPAISAGISALGQVASNVLTRPKKRRSMLAEQLRALDEGAAQTANQATANAGYQLGPMLNSRGMQNSGVGAGIMAGLASGNAQAAAGEANKMRLPLIMGEQARIDADEQEKRERNRQMLSGLGDTLATNVAGYGATLAQTAEQKKLMDLLRDLYGNDPEKLQIMMNSLMPNTPRSSQTYNPSRSGSYGMIPPFRD